MPHVVQVATPLVGQEEVDAASEVILSGQYVSGAKVEAFERAFAEYVGARHAVATSNGTSALYIALQAMGVGPGDEVLVPAVTFFATVTSIIRVGAKPVFVDLDIDDFCLSPVDAAGRITPRTKAILPVHYFGAAAKMDAIMDLARAHRLLVLEDCAQAHGSRFDGRIVGSIGRAGAFSFFATKHMTTGEGGMITTDDEELARLARIRRNHGLVGRDDHVLLGYNDRMNEIAAAIGLAQLRKLDVFNEKRIANSREILARLGDLDWITMPVPSDPRIVHTFFWCPVMVRPESGRTMDALKSHLTEHGIGFRHRYSEPLYRQPALAEAGLDYSSLRLPNAERMCGNVIGLPNHPKLTDEELDRVVEAVHSF